MFPFPFLPQLSRMLTSRSETEVAHEGKDKLLLRAVMLAKLASLTLQHESKIDEYFFGDDDCDAKAEGDASNVDAGNVHKHDVANVGHDESKQNSDDAAMGDADVTETGGDFTSSLSNHDSSHEMNDSSSSSSSSSLSSSLTRSTPLPPTAAAIPGSQTALLAYSFDNASGARFDTLVSYLYSLYAMDSSTKSSQLGLLDDSPKIIQTVSNLLQDPSITSSAALQSSLASSSSSSSSSSAYAAMVQTSRYPNYDKAFLLAMTAWDKKLTAAASSELLLKLGREAPRIPEQILPVCFHILGTLEIHFMDLHFLFNFLFRICIVCAVIRNDSRTF